MTYYITHITDFVGQNYLGIKIPTETLQSYLNELKEILGEEDYNLFTENQQRRDSGEYHITVINVADYNKICKEVGIDKFVSSLDVIFKLITYPSHERQSGSIAFVAISPRRTDSVLI